METYQESKYPVYVHFALEVVSVGVLLNLFYIIDTNSGLIKRTNPIGLF